MTTYTFKNITLEHDREWRAWVTPSREEGFLPGEEYREQECLHVSGTGPGQWRNVNDGSHVCRARLPRLDYRRPAPLPSLDPGLVEVLKHTGVFCAGEQQYVRPSRWRPTGGCYWEDLVTREQCLEELRTLLPGYEEQLAKHSVNTVSMMFRWADGERPTEPQPSPVPADGWRPIETAPKDGSVILSDGHHVGEGFWHDGSKVHPGRGIAGWFWMEDAADLLIARNANATHWQPLPPPPQEKGGEA